MKYIQRLLTNCNKSKNLYAPEKSKIRSSHFIFKVLTVIDAHLKN